MSTLTVAQDGRVKLESGLWDWRIRQQPSGSMVVFTHRDRPRDEMRTWTSEEEITPERALELAAEPVERLWVDADGLLWSIVLDLPSDWGRARIPHAEQAVNLVFTCGGWRKVVIAPADTKLGEISSFDLGRMFRTA